MLILSFLFLTALWFGFQNKARWMDVNLALVKAFLLMCLITAVSTEALSFFYVFNRVNVLSLWGGLSALMAFLCWRKRKILFENLKDFKTQFKTIGAAEWVVCLCFLALLIMLAVVAFAFPTNRGDPYHMARIGHWVQQASVLPYPVRDDRQIIALPFDEYLMTHFFHMTDSDRFAPFVQWLCYFYCGLAVALTASWLKLKPKFCLYACFLFWLLPMAILQSVSAQNNLMVTFMVLTAVYFAFRGAQEKGIQNAFFCAVAMACGLLTKGTFYLFIIPFGAWAGITVLCKDRMYALKMGGIIAFLCLLINGPVWIRNTHLYGNPISASQAFLEKYKTFTTSKLIITDPTFKKSLLILSKNMLSHTVPAEGSFLPDFNPEVKALFSAMEISFHDSQVNVNYNPEKKKHDTIKRVVHENRAGNAIHLYLIIFSTLFFLLFSKEKKKMALYVAVLWGMYFMYSSLIKWSPFRTRLDIPFFAYGIVFVAYMAERYSFSVGFKKLKISTNMLIFFCVAAMSQPYFAHMANRLNDWSKTRYETQFITKKTLRKPYTEAAELMKKYHVKHLGYYIANTQWDYMLFPAVWENAGRDYQVRSIRIRPYYEDLWKEKPFTYEAILTDDEKFKEKNEKLYRKVFPLKEKFFFILLKKPSNQSYR